METDERFLQIDGKLTTFSKELVGAMEQVRAEASMALQQKPEFSDLETMAHKINTKADVQKV
jgi:hypothetical protein